MYTLCVSYIIREDANFVGIGGCVDNDGVRTCSPEKKGHSMSFSTEEKRWANRFFDEKYCLDHGLLEKKLRGQELLLEKKGKQVAINFVLSIHQNFKSKC